MVNDRLASIEQPARWPARMVLTGCSLLLLWLAAGWVLAVAPWPAAGSTGPALAPAGAVLAPAATPTVPAICQANWLVVSSPNVYSRTNLLRAISSGPDNDLWAVGSFAIADTAFSLTEHWDGTQWQQIPSPNPGPNGTLLYSVARIAANDVWVVGTQYNGNSGRMLALHWDGTLWSATPLPGGNPVGALYGVAGTAANDVWAVGTTFNYTNPAPIYHWDGTAWTLSSAIISPGTSNVLNAVAARAPNDVWAVGSYVTNFSSQRMLITHWDGQQWSAVIDPGPGQLTAVVALAGTDMWAGGGDGFSGAAVHWDGVNYTVVPLPGGLVRTMAARAANDIWATHGTAVTHWDGQTWQPVPLTGPADATFQGVGVTPGSTWLVGDYDQNGDVRQSLALRRIGTTWSQAATPIIISGARGTDLGAVAAAGTNDVWAVGSYQATRAGFSYTLAQHWDGSAWRIVDTPNIAFGYQRLFGVTAFSPTDVWAVGQWEDGSLAAAPGQSAPAQPGAAADPARPAMDLLLIEHWDGTRWQMVPAPNPGTTYESLQAVAGVAANDIWAVGYTEDGQYSGQPLLLHWDGAGWAIAPSPSPGPGRSRLYAVSARAANDVWAVGVTLDGSTQQALIMHWDGSQWSVVSPPVLGVGSLLRGVVANSATDAWAVGAVIPSAGAQAQTLILHWTGSAWSQVPSPSVGGSDNTLNSVTRLASGEGWAVGSYGTYPNFQPLVLHSTGTAWTLVPATQTFPGAGAALLGVTALTPNDVWAVGAASPFIYAPQTLIEHYGNVLPFSDVPPSDTFYSYIRCLACRGLINGYPDGTFRPANNTIRGQAAKFVANAAGYTDPISPTQQTFNDVPPGNPYWLYVERVALHNVIEGYPCGGPGEPCPGRYFRPTNVVTRAQMSKFIAGSAGYTDPIPSTQQTFNDVPPGDALWLYVERVYAHGIISGYPCGGPGEPCPGRYFRPVNNLTRGQTAKFIAGAFFPNCAVPPQSR